MQEAPIPWDTINANAALKSAKNRKKLEEARLAKMQQKQTQQQKAQPVTNIQKTQLTGQVTFNKLKHNK